MGYQKALVALAGLMLAGCAVIPLGPVRVADGGRWIARPADGGEPAAAMWGSPRGEASYSISCTRPGVIAFVMPATAPTPDGRWRLTSGRVTETVPAIYDGSGLAVEQADLAADSRLARVLARDGGPLQVQAAGSAVTLPANPLVARIVADCAR